MKIRRIKKETYNTQKCKLKIISDNLGILALFPLFRKIPGYLNPYIVNYPGIHDLSHKGQLTKIPFFCYFSHF
jgi:hypothetical protein